MKFGNFSINDFGDIKKLNKRRRDTLCQREPIISTGRAMIEDEKAIMSAGETEEEFVRKKEEKQCSK